MELKMLYPFSMLVVAFALILQFQPSQADDFHKKSIEHIQCMGKCSQVNIDCKDQANREPTARSRELHIALCAEDWQYCDRNCPPGG
jgi:hypothetical protein